MGTQAQQTSGQGAGKAGDEAKRSKFVPPPPGHKEKAGRAADSEASGREKRIHERRTVERDAIVTEVQHNGAIGVSWPCKTADLSRGGVGLLSRRLVQRGTALLIRIHGVDGKMSTPLYGTVMHARYASDGEHILGVCFGPIPERRSIREWVEANKD
jgi:hypothetical protein